MSGHWALTWKVNPHTREKTQVRVWVEDPAPPRSRVAGAAQAAALVAAKKIAAQQAQKRAIALTKRGTEQAQKRAVDARTRAFENSGASHAAEQLRIRKQRDLNITNARHLAYERLQAQTKLLLNYQAARDEDQADRAQQRKQISKNQQAAAAAGVKKAADDAAMETRKRLLLQKGGRGWNKDRGGGTHRYAGGPPPVPATPLTPDEAAELERVIQWEAENSKNDKFHLEDVTNLQKQYEKHATKTYKAYEAAVAKVNAAIEKYQKTGKSSDLVKARAAYAEYMKTKPEFDRLFGDGTNPLVDGSYNATTQQYKQIDFANRDYWKRQMKASFQTTIDNAQDKADRDTPEYAQAREMLYIMNGKTQTRWIEGGFDPKTHRPIRRRATPEEEIAIRQAEKIAEAEKLRHEYETQQTKIRVQMMREGYVEYKGRYVEGAQMPAAKQAQETMDKSYGGEFKPTKPNEIHNFVTDMLKDWEVRNPRPAGLTMTNPAFLAWQKARQQTENEFFKFFGMGPQGMLEKGMASPGVGEALTLLNTPFALVGFAGRTANAALFGQGKIGGYDPSIADWFNEFGTDASGKDPSKLEERYKAWLQTPAGQRWFANKRTANEAADAEQRNTFLNDFYGPNTTGDLFKGLKALQDFGNAPFQADNLNLLAGLLLDPLNVIPLNFLKFAQRARFSLETTKDFTGAGAKLLGKTKGYKLFSTFRSVDEGTLSLWKHTGSLEKELLAKGMTRDEFLGLLQERVLGITKKSARETAVRDLFRQIGLSPQKVNEAQLFSLAEHLIEIKAIKKGQTLWKAADEAKKNLDAAVATREAAAKVRAAELRASREKVAAEASRVKAEAEAARSLQGAAKTAEEKRLAAVVSAEKAVPKPAPTPKPAPKPKPVPKPAPTPSPVEAAAAKSVREGAPVPPSIVKAVEKERAAVPERPYTAAEEFYVEDVIGASWPKNSKTMADPAYDSLLAKAAGGDKRAYDTLHRMARRERNVFRTQQQDLRFLDKRAKPVWVGTAQDLAEAAGTKMAGAFRLAREKAQIRFAKARAGKASDDLATRRITSRPADTGTRGRNRQFITDHDMAYTDGVLRQDLPGRVFVGQDIIKAREETFRGLHGAYDPFTRDNMEYYRAAPVDSFDPAVSLLRRLDDPDYLSKMDAPEFLYTMRNLAATPSDLRGVGVFRDYGQWVFEVFHQLRLANKTEQLAAFSVRVDRMILDNPDNIFAHMWRVMEDRAGLLDDSVDPQALIDAFYKTAEDWGMHPELAAAMIPWGYAGKVPSSGFGLSPRLEAAAMNAWFVVAPRLWATNTKFVADEITSIARGAGGFATRVMHYMATKHGAFMIGTQGWVRILDELAYASITKLDLDGVVEAILKQADQIDSEVFASIRGQARQRAFHDQALARASKAVTSEADTRWVEGLRSAPKGSKDATRHRLTMAEETALRKTEYAQAYAALEALAPANVETILRNMIGRQHGNISRGLHPEYKGFRKAVLAAYGKGLLPIDNPEFHKLMLLFRLQTEPAEFIGAAHTYVTYMNKIGHDLEASRLVYDIFEEEMRIDFTKFLPSQEVAFGKTVKNAEGNAMGVYGNQRMQLWRDAGLTPGSARLKAFAEERAKVRSATNKAAEQDAVRLERLIDDTVKPNDALVGRTELDATVDNLKSILDELEVLRNPKVVSPLRFDRLERIVDAKGSPILPASKKVKTVLTGEQAAALARLEKANAKTAEFAAAKAAGERASVIRTLEREAVRQLKSLAYKAVDTGGQRITADVMIELERLVDTLRGSPQLRSVMSRFRHDIADMAHGERIRGGVDAFAYETAMLRFELRRISENVATKSGSRALRKPIKGYEAAHSALQKRLSDIEGITDSLERRAPDVPTGEWVFAKDDAAVAGRQQRLGLEDPAAAAKPKTGRLSPSQREEAIRNAERDLNARTVSGELDRRPKKPLSETDRMTKTKKGESPHLAMERKTAEYEAKIERAEVVSPVAAAERPKIDIDAPRPIETAPLSMAEIMLGRLFKMSEPEWYAYQKSLIHAALKSKTATVASKARARAQLAQIELAELALRIEKNRGTHVTWHDRAAFQSRVLKTHGKDAEGHIAPRMISPKVAEAADTLVEEARVYHGSLKRASPNVLPSEVGIKIGGVEADHLPLRVFKDIDARISVAVRAEKGYTSDMLTKSRRGGVLEESARPLGRMTDTDPRVVAVKERVLREYFNETGNFIPMAAYDEARKVLWKGHTQGMTANRLLRATQQYVDRWGGDFGDVFDRLRQKWADKEARNQLGGMAFGDMYGVDPEVIWGEFLHRYSDDGAIKHFAPELTQFQVRTLEEGFRELSGLSTRDALVGKFLQSVNRPPFEAGQGATREFLKKIGVWSPRTTEDFILGQKSWSVFDEEFHWLAEYGDVPPWARVKDLEGDLNEIFDDQYKYIEFHKKQGVFSRSGELAHRMDGVDAKRIEEAHFVGDEALGIAARRSLDEQRRYAIQRFGRLVSKDGVTLDRMPWLMYPDELRKYVVKDAAKKMPPGMIRSLRELGEVEDLIDSVMDRFWNKYIDPAATGGVILQEDVFRLAAEIQQRLLADPRWAKRMRDRLGSGLDAWASFNRWMVFSNPSFMITNVIDAPIKTAWYRFTRRGLFQRTLENARWTDDADALMPAMLNFDATPAIYRQRQLGILDRIKDPRGYSRAERIVDRALALREVVPGISGQMFPAMAGRAELAMRMNLARGMWPQVYETMIKRFKDPDLARAASLDFVKKEVKKMWPEAGSGPIEQLWNRFVPFSSYQIKNKKLWISEVIDHPVILSQLDRIGRAIERENLRVWEADPDHHGEPMPENLRRLLELPWAKGYFIDLGQFTDASRGIAPLYKTTWSDNLSTINSWFRVVNPSMLAGILGVANAFNIAQRTQWQAVVDEDGFPTGEYREVRVPWTEPWSKDQATLGSAFWFVDAIQTGQKYGIDGWDAGEASAMFGQVFLFNAITTYDKWGVTYGWYKGLSKADKATYIATPEGIKLAEWLRTKMTTPKGWNLSLVDLVAQHDEDPAAWWHAQSPKFRKTVDAARDKITAIREMFTGEMYLLQPGTEEYKTLKSRMYLAISDVYRETPELLQSEVYSKSASEWAQQTSDWQTDALVDTYIGLSNKRPQRATFASTAAYNKAVDDWNHSKEVFLNTYPNVAKALRGEIDSVAAVRVGIERQWDAVLTRISKRTDAINEAKAIIAAHGRSSAQGEAAQGRIDLLYLQNDLDYSLLERDYAAFYFTEDDQKKMDVSFGSKPPFIKRVQTFLDFDATIYQKNLKAGTLEDYLAKAQYGQMLKAATLYAKGGDPFGEFNVVKWMKYLKDNPATEQKMFGGDARARDAFAKASVYVDGLRAIWAKAGDDAGEFVRLLKKNPALLAEYFKRNPGKQAQWAHTDAYIRNISVWGKLVGAQRYDEANAVWDRMPQWVKDEYYKKHPEKRKQAQQTAQYLGFMDKWVKLVGTDEKKGMEYFRSLPKWAQDRYFSKHPENRLKFEANEEMNTLIAGYFAAPDADRAEYLSKNPKMVQWLAKNVGSQQAERMAILQAYKAIPADEAWLRRAFREKYPEIFSAEAAGTAKLKSIHSVLTAHNNMVPVFEKWVEEIWKTYSEMLKLGQARPLKLYFKRDREGERLARERLSSRSAAQVSGPA